MTTCLLPGHCANYSELFECHFTADGIIVDAERDNMKLNGFFYCRGSNCTQIKKPFPCDRYCSKITTSSMTIFVMHNNSLTTMDCDAAHALTESRGSELGLRIDPPVKIWDETMGYLLTNCIDIQRVGDGNFIAYDCLNGTLLQDPTVVPEPYTNFTTFWKIYENSTVILDHTQKYLPKQSSLTIYNTTKLFINLEGCVNTLKGECKEFLFTHGQDGRKNTAQSRYECFYKKHHETFVVARFDLAKTWRELMIAVIVPATLFVISFTALTIITHTVRVGDDAKMRCKYCTGADSEIDDFGNLVTEQPISSPVSSSAAVVAAAKSQVKGGKNKDLKKVTDGRRLKREQEQHQQQTEVEAEEPVEERINGGGSVVVGQQDVKHLSATNRGDDHVLIPLSPCTEVDSQKDTDENGVVESCLSTKTTTTLEPPEAAPITKEGEDVDPEQPLMIL